MKLLTLPRRDLLHVTLTSLPIVALNLTMVWFTVHRISPSPSVEGSSSNLFGLITSNFVYDGLGNVENLVTSSGFLLFVFLYYPAMLRILSAFLISFAAVAIGVFAELTTVSTVYFTPRICGGACTFYGMSAVSNAVVGFTLASFITCFFLMALQVRVRPRSTQIAPALMTRYRDKIVLISVFVLYLALLLLYAGLIGLPASSGHVVSGAGGVSPSPPAILTQSPPEWLVHTTSLSYGFAMFAAIFVVVNGRYRFFVTKGHGHGENVAIKPG